MGQKMSEIKSILEHTQIEKLPQSLEAFRADSRIGVMKLVEKYDKKYRDYQGELSRIEGMLVYEREYQAYHSICGVDEAGRGPLAGPVVAGAVILPKDKTILYLNDSKQVSEKMREILYDEVMEKAVAVGVGISSPEEIDEMNILQATYLAMRRAIENLSAEPDILFNDAVTIPKVECRQIPIIKGDAKSLSIAAASIIAKVTRDRMMRMYDEIYPEYGFAGHKGYGSASHIEVIRRCGASPIHRKSFIKKFIPAW